MDIDGAAAAPSAAPAADEPEKLDLIEFIKEQVQPQVDAPASADVVRRRAGGTRAIAQPGNEGFHCDNGWGWEY